MIRCARFWVVLAAVLAVSSGRVPAGEPSPDKVPVVVVKAAPRIAGMPRVGRLRVEIFRQALLAMAREDFGALVRDEALGEFAPNDARSPVFLQLDVANSGTPIDLARVGPDGSSRRGGWLLQQKIGSGCFFDPNPRGLSPPSGFPVATTDMGRTVAAALGFSEKFAAALRKAGLEPRPAVGEGVGAGDLTARLREMSFVPQFEAVRAAHRSAAGTEKERLLAVGYANLSLLTQHHWAASCKIFAARALIYAERGARRDPGPDSEEVLAYCDALTGQHAKALKHAEAAGVDRSDRLRAVVAYCRYRCEELLKLSAESAEVRKLAAVLAAVAADEIHNPDLTAETLGATQIVLMHDVTARGPARLMGAVPERLKAAPDLPAGVREAASVEKVYPADLCDRLDVSGGTAASRAEPSWPVLGRVLRDETLVQAHRRLSFLVSPLGLPTGDACRMLRRFVGSHRYGVAIDYFAADVDAEALKAILRTFREGHPSAREGGPWQPAASEDFVPRDRPLAELALKLGEKQEAAALWSDMLEQADQTADDIAQIAASVAEPDLGFGVGDTLHPADSRYVVSPFHPQRMIRAVGENEASDEQIAAWERELADQPALLATLGRIFPKERSNDAVRFLTRSAELKPCFTVFESLAKVHRDAGREDEYIAAMEKAFRYPSYSLGEAKDRVELAKLYMARRDFKKAEPHAAAAAESFAAWAIPCAIDCYTALGEWEKAEAWAKGLSERYSSSAATWYLWCRRTGRGDVASAKRLLMPWIAAWNTPPEQAESDELWNRGIYGLAMGDPTAEPALATIARKLDAPAAGVIAAAGFLHAGRKQEAADILKFCSGLKGDAGKRAGILFGSLGSGKPLDAETVAEFDRSIDGFKDDDPLRYRAVFGEIFIHLGNRDDGLRFLKRVADAGPPEVWLDQNAVDRAYAALWLREHEAEKSGKGGKEGAPAEGQPDA